MAAPNVSYSELLTAAHNQGVGFTFRNFTITVKELVFGVWHLVITRQANSWDVWYKVQSTGEVGRIVKVIDAQGVQWRNNYADGWVAR